MMALVDTLEALAASYNKGLINLQYAACVLNLSTIKELLDLSCHFGVEFIGTNPITRDKLNAEERVYEGWRSTSIRTS